MPGQGRLPQGAAELSSGERAAHRPQTGLFWAVPLVLKSLYRFGFRPSLKNHRPEGKAWSGSVRMESVLFPNNNSFLCPAGTHAPP